MRRYAMFPADHTIITDEELERLSEKQSGYFEKDGGKGVKHDIFADGFLNGFKASLHYRGHYLKSDIEKALQKGVNIAMENTEMQDNGFGVDVTKFNTIGMVRASKEYLSSLNPLNKEK